MFIILSTGKISKTQIFSLVTSVLSLSWGASRAFLIMRTADKADPDPEITTVALRIWPLMLVITITDLVCLVYMAGLSGGYVFVAISVNFLTTYVVLWKTMKELPGAGEDIESPEEEQQREASAEEKPKEEEESFLFAASVCSTWIPSVVGDPEQRFFLKAGEVLSLSLLCRNPLYLSKLPRCCEPRHEECLPCRCDHPRLLWNPQGSPLPSPLR